MVTVSLLSMLNNASAVDALAVVVGAEFGFRLFLLPRSLQAKVGCGLDRLLVHGILWDDGRLLIHD